MKDKKGSLLWVCLTILIVAGLKYVPAYMAVQRQLDIEDRALDLKEDSFLHQRSAPTVSLPEHAEQRMGQLL